jgi:hypothetical protein
MREERCDFSVLSAVVIAAAGVSLFLADDLKIPMLLLIAGSGLGLIDQYRERRR